MSQDHGQDGVRKTGRLVSGNQVIVTLKGEKYNDMPYYVLTAFIDFQRCLCVWTLRIRSSINSSAPTSMKIARIGERRSPKSSAATSGIAPEKISKKCSSK